MRCDLDCSLLDLLLKQILTELEALSTEVLEDEEPSAYLTEVTAPDFIDEAPVEVSLRFCNSLSLCPV